MSTDLERVLREGMERFTSDLEMPPGLARKAYQRRVRRRRSTFLLAAAGTALVVGVTTALIAGPARTSRPGNGLPPPASAMTAAYVLNRAALAAASSQEPVPHPGQYVYVHSVGTGLVLMPRPSSRVPSAWLSTSDRWIWLSVSGRKAGLLHARLAGQEQLPWGPKPPSYPPSSRDSWMPLPALAACPSAQRGCRPARGTYAFLTTLPTSPTRLRAWIFGHPNGQQPPDEQAWTDIGDMLREMLVPPQLAAALFRVAATIPGATVIPHVTDAAGRSGIAVARYESAFKANAELIFDPRTYQLLGEGAVLASPVKGEGPAGTVIGASAQLNVGVADHLPRHVSRAREAFIAG